MAINGRFTAKDGTLRAPAVRETLFDAFGRSAETVAALAALVGSHLGLKYGPTLDRYPQMGDIHGRFVADRLHAAVAEMQPPLGQGLNEGPELVQKYFEVGATAAGLFGRPPAALGAYEQRVAELQSKVEVA